MVDERQRQIGEEQEHIEEERQVAHVVKAYGTLQAEVLKHSETIPGPSGGLTLELVDLQGDGRGKDEQYCA